MTASGKKLFHLVGVADVRHLPAISHTSPLLILNGIRPEWATMMHSMDPTIIAVKGCLAHGDEYYVLKCEFDGQHASFSMPNANLNNRGNACSVDPEQRRIEHLQNHINISILPTTLVNDLEESDVLSL
jgi:hypothetical protein